MTNRPLVAVTIAYIAGIIAARFLLEDSFPVYLLVAVTILTVLTALYWRKIFITTFMLITLAVVFLTKRSCYYLMEEIFYFGSFGIVAKR